MPPDARDIFVQSDAETGQYLVTYRSDSPLHAAKMVGMSRIRPGREDALVRQSVGFGAALVRDSAIYYRCFDGASDHAKGEWELVFLADSESMQQQWNKVYSHELADALCADTGGAVLNALQRQQAKPLTTLQ